jgi:hypothetical protein
MITMSDEANKQLKKNALRSAVRPRLYAFSAVVSTGEFIVKQERKTRTKTEEAEPFTMPLLTKPWKITQNYSKYDTDHRQQT